MCLNHLVFVFVAALATTIQAFSEHVDSKTSRSQGAKRLMTQTTIPCSSNDNEYLSLITDNALEHIVVEVGTNVVWVNAGTKTYTLEEAEEDALTGDFSFFGRSRDKWEVGPLRPTAGSNPILFDEVGIFPYMSREDEELEATVTVVEKSATQLTNSSTFVIKTARIVGRSDPTNRRATIVTLYYELEFAGDIEGTATGNMYQIYPVSGGEAGQCNVQSLRGVLDFVDKRTRLPTRAQILIDGTSSNPEGASTKGTIYHGDLTFLPHGGEGPSVEGRGEISIHDIPGGHGNAAFDLTTPQVSAKITMEPTKGAKFLYLPIAPFSADAAYSPKSLIILHPTVKNIGGDDITLTEIRVSFQGPPATPMTVIPKDITIEAGESKDVVTSRDENVIVHAFPPPPGMTVSFYFAGFASPVVTAFNLERHDNPKPHKSYLFPGKYKDLGRDEFWSAATGHKGSSQRFGYDMGIVKWDNGNGAWTNKKNGKDGSNNEDYLIWEKPIYAMADGEVIYCQTGIDDNPNPPDKINGGGGNSFLIRHKNDFVLYAHMKKGSIEVMAGTICMVGAMVAEGQMLGLAGNSGSSTAPHLHIHAIGSIDTLGLSDGRRRVLMLFGGCDENNRDMCSLRPLPFRGAKVVRRQDIPDEKKPLDAKWVTIDGGGPPHREKNILLPAACGNGLLDIGEQCEYRSENFGDKTCEHFGFQAGSLRCTDTCLVDLSGCRGGGNKDLPPRSYGDCGYTASECDNDPSKCNADGACLGGPCARTNVGDWNPYALTDIFNFEGEFHPDGDFRDKSGHLYYCRDDTQWGEMVCRDVNGWGVCKRCTGLPQDVLNTRLGCQCNQDDDCFSASLPDPDMSCYGQDFGAGPGFCWDVQDGPPSWQCREGTCGQPAKFDNDEMYCEHYPEGPEAQCQPWYACNSILARKCAGQGLICKENSNGMTDDEYCTTECDINDNCQGGGWPVGYVCAGSPLSCTK